jgi:hypothetical protein
MKFHSKKVAALAERAEYLRDCFWWGHRSLGNGVKSSQLPLLRRVEKLCLYLYLYTDERPTVDLKKSEKQLNDLAQRIITETYRPGAFPEIVKRDRLAWEEAHPNPGRNASPE